MQHLVVVAYPAGNSFTMGLIRSYAAELERLGHSQRTCDLYRMGFDPVLAAQELLPAVTTFTKTSNPESKASGVDYKFCYS